MKTLRLFFIASVLFSFDSITAQNNATISLLPDENAPVIEKEIYGQFAEHLGTCIYGGLWVGPDSPIPNVNGYRTDVLNALKSLQIPVLRWPGGCFADVYHWTDGIGPQNERPSLVNIWGGTLEDNSFGTNEFFNLCELLGCEPYLSGNVGSGTVEELADWVEYITASQGPMAELRRKNGRQEPWKLKYLGVGNESWGCGGNFTPQFYADTYRRYQTYCRNFDDNRLYKIASGASDYDYNWTKVMMENAGRYMDGLSLHYYTIYDWDDKGSATEFDTERYYYTLGKCLEIEDVLKRHIDIMNVYDPKQKVGLIVDEWGTWFDEEPGTISGHLYQQNTMRDAMVAALSLNVFHNYTNRVKMANIAQIANVLQSMVLTKGEQMVLTPTYYVFKMYIPHQGATLIPLKVKSPSVGVFNGKDIPAVSATASTKNETTTISIVNTSVDKDTQVTINLNGIKAQNISGEILTADAINAYNDFGKPQAVNTAPFEAKNWKVKNGELTVSMPAKSIVTLSLK